MSPVWMQYLFWGKLTILAKTIYYEQDDARQRLMCRWTMSNPKHTVQDQPHVIITVLFRHSAFYRFSASAKYENIRNSPSLSYQCYWCSWQKTLTSFWFIYFIRTIENRTRRTKKQKMRIFDWVLTPQSWYFSEYQTGSSKNLWRHLGEIYMEWRHWRF